MVPRTLQILSLLFLFSCVLSKSDPLESSWTAAPVPDLIPSGDILVVNSGNDTIVSLDPEGNYRSIVYDSPTDATLLFGALAWDPINSTILFTYDSTTAALDKIKQINPVDGEVTNVLSNSNLNGVMPGVARLASGELAVLEGTTTVELFSAEGIRSGNPFLATITASSVNISALANGGFVTCSTGTANTVRLYTSAGAIVGTATSALPLPTLGALAATDCIEDGSGRIIVSYSGATDYVRAYSSDLSAVIWTFYDANVLTTPGKLAFRSNGNILVTDTAFNHIVEISSSGALVGTLGGGVLSTPASILVVP